MIFMVIKNVQVYIFYKQLLRMMHKVIIWNCIYFSDQIDEVYFQNNYKLDLLLNLSNMSAYRRLEAQIEASRRIAYERQLDLSRLHQFERIERERQYFRLKEAEKLRAEEQYEQFRLRRLEQQKIAEQQIFHERVARETACRQYEARVEAERLARQARDKQLQIKQRLTEQEQIRRAQALAQSRKADLQRKEQLKSDMDRQNIAILDEQKIQQKLERELSEIEIKIGTIYDERQARKRKELDQLQNLDKESFRLKQAMRSSKVQQKALEQSLAQLSKIIV